VSIPTVSKVLNGRSDVAAATRARVESALASSGYRRRRAATPSSSRWVVQGAPGASSSFITRPL
jgi:DNA-binding LacI/PurR family transcriptional regulator